MCLIYYASTIQSIDSTTDTFGKQCRWSKKKPCKVLINTIKHVNKTKPKLKPTLLLLRLFLYKVFTLFLFFTFFIKSKPLFTVLTTLFAASRKATLTIFTNFPSGFIPKLIILHKHSFFLINFLCNLPSGFYSISLFIYWVSSNCENFAQRFDLFVFCHLGFS